MPKANLVSSTRRALAPLVENTATEQPAAPWKEAGVKLTADQLDTIDLPLHRAADFARISA
jgi:hypothetical protein